MNNIKENIENEITKINNTYDKVLKEVTECFKKKHEKLIKEENELVENLQSEVTKIKEKLEFFLSQAIQIIKKSESINKGIKSIEKDEKNIIKTFTYVSKINKNKKEINKLNNQLIKNTKISFKEEETKIEFDEYYFSRILTKFFSLNKLISNNFLNKYKSRGGVILCNPNKHYVFKPELKECDLLINPNIDASSGIIIIKCSSNNF